MRKFISFHFSCLLFIYYESLFHFLLLSGTSSFSTLILFFLLTRPFSEFCHLCLSFSHFCDHILLCFIGCLLHCFFKIFKAQHFLSEVFIKSYIYGYYQLSLQGYHLHQQAWWGLVLFPHCDFCTQEVYFCVLYGVRIFVYLFCEIV